MSAQTRPWLIFISVDMEGISGVVDPAQLGPDGFEYQRAREWMTGEVNAAITAIRAAGPAEIVVCDSHGNGQSVLIDKLPDDVRIVRGFPRPLEMMQGIDETFAAAVFIGYHASEWTVDAVRGHTISSARLLGVKLNGMKVSEGIFNAALAGQFGVPVAFVSGDRLPSRNPEDRARRRRRHRQGAVRLSFGGDGDAGTRAVADRRRRQARDGEAGIAPALSRHGARGAQVGFKLTIDAERAAYVPGLSRADAHNVKGPSRTWSK